MSTVLDEVRRYFPEATEDEAGYILWNRTGFPCFWRTTPRHKTPVSVLRAQLREYRAALMKLERHPGAALCDFCNRLARVDGLCRQCDAALHTEDEADALHEPGKETSQ